MIRDDAINDILEFWFGHISEGFSAPEMDKLWYGFEAANDKQIERDFGLVIEAALAGTLDRWKVTPHGRLALIIVLDQFTRMVYRRSARAFAGDPRALALCRGGIAREQDQQLLPVERLFFYQPLEHSERLNLHDFCLRKFKALADSLPAERASDGKSWLRFASSHRDLIERFGRYPHRNKALGRTSTPEEVEYLAQDARRFGQ